MLGKALALGSIGLILAIALFRAVFIFKPLPPPTSCINHPGHARIKLDDQILDRLKGALSIPTISYGEHRYEPEQLTKLIEFIKLSFPHIHSSSFVERELIANYTLLYTIKGTDESLRPYMLTSHMDVVPVVREKWSSDPFKAVIKEDKHIYARGAMDAKHLVVAMLEAFELMLKNGFRPKRGFYFVFGHDEEVGGGEGAQTVADVLGKRINDSHWDKLEYILDEGLFITKTRFPGLDTDIGLIGVAEKGYLTVKLSATGSVGHGSMPPHRTAIAKLGKAVAKFHAHLMPSYIGQGVEKEMIDIFASHASWPYKFAFANFWLFKPIFSYMFDNEPGLNSLIRTSTAVTVIRGGTKENVLPDSAEAYINHRVHPLQTIEEIIEMDKRTIDDATISVEAYGHRKESSPVAPYGDDAYGYQLIKHSVLQIYPNTVIVPSTFSAATDSHWYTGLTDSIYKFSAIAIHSDEMNRFHGHDERLSLENYENLLNFFHHLIQNSNEEKMQFKPIQRSDL